MNNQVIQTDVNKIKHQMDISIDSIDQFEEYLASNGLLSLSLSSQIRNIRDAMTNRYNTNIGTSGILAFIQSLRDSFETEMESHLIYVVPPDRRECYSDPIDWFGKDIVDKFPSITRDVRDAAQCYAFGQWTAAVFHAARVLELGLQIMAKRHGVKNPELLQWENLIKAIEDSVAKIIQMPRTTRRQKLLLADSQAAMHLRFFKDGWRNPVSHPHVDCDEQEAEQVLAHVKDFMGALAKR